MTENAHRGGYPGSAPARPIKRPTSAGAGSGSAPTKTTASYEERTIAVLEQIATALETIAERMKL